MRLFILIFFSVSLYGLQLPGFERAIHRKMGSGVAVAVVDAKTTHFMEAFGGMELQTSVPVGGLKKARIALIIAQLVDKGVIGWDTPLQTILPSLWLKDPVVTRQITFADCLSERSGLPDQSFRLKHSSEPQAIRLAEQALVALGKKDRVASWNLQEAIAWLRYHLSKGVINKRPTVNPIRIDEIFEPQVVRFEGVGNGLLQAQALGWAIEEIDGQRIAWCLSEKGALIVLPDWGIGVVVLGDGDLQGIALAAVDGLMGRVALKSVGDVFFLPPRSYL